MRRILVAVGIVVLLFTMVMSCERIDAGHVGVKVDMYGSGKGVNDVTECTGVVFYNPITTKIVLQEQQYSLLPWSTHQIRDLSCHSRIPFSNDPGQPQQWIQR